MYGNFENILAPAADKDFSIEEDRLITYYEEKIRSSNEGRLHLSEDDFSDTFNKQLISADKKRLNEVKPQFESKERGQRAELLATFVAHEGSLKGEGFFGDCEVVMTTEFDDVFNGVDLILQMKKRTVLYVI